MESVAIWMLLAAVTASATYMLWRKSRMKASAAIILPILVFYLSFVLTITIFERVASREAQYMLELFWSYKAVFAGKTQLIAENFWNVLLFLPIGVLTAGLLPRRREWLSILLCAAGSAAIEVIQLVTHRGLFEFDDIFHNTLGAVIGVFMFMIVKTYLKRRTE